MKKEYVKMVLCLLSMLTLFSFCKKEWLDVKTDKNLVVPSTLKDFQSLLDNTTVMNFNSVGLGEVGSDGHYIADNFFSSYLSNSEKNSYTWSSDLPYLEVLDWENTFRRVFYSNVVLDGLPSIADGTVIPLPELNNIKGQALFQRARSLYEAAQVWAPPFNPTTSAQDFGIPVRLEADINVPTKRANVKQTYDQIISDLTMAKDILPMKPLIKTRASKISTFALLARVYLSIKDYVMAGQYADSCLVNFGALVNYNSVDSSQSYPFQIFNNEVLFHSTMINYIALYGSIATIDSVLYNSYSPDDLRRTLFFNYGSSSKIAFRGNYFGGGGPQFNGLAVDEVLLIRSECYARNGDIPKAMDDLNMLLRSRWRENTFTNISANTVKEALTVILTERRKELIFRGVRWSDLRRLNSDPNVGITLSKVVLGKKYILAPNSSKYTLPIPSDIIKQTGIKQNTGW